MTKKDIIELAEEYVKTIPCTGERPYITVPVKQRIEINIKKSGVMPKEQIHSVDFISIMSNKFGNLEYNWEFFKIN